MEKQLNAAIKNTGLVLVGALLGYVITTFVLNTSCPTPTNLRVVKKDYTSIDIAWDGLVDASFYTVVVRDSILPDSVISLTSVEGTSTSIKNLTPGKPYLIDVYSVCQLKVGANKTVSADISALPARTNATTDFVIVFEIPPTILNCNFNNCTPVTVNNNQFAWDGTATNYKIRIRKGSVTGAVMATNYLIRDKDASNRPRVNYFRTGPCSDVAIIPVPAVACVPAIPATLCGSFVDGTTTVNYQIFFSNNTTSVLLLPAGYVVEVSSCGTASVSKGDGTK